MILILMCLKFYWSSICHYKMETKLMILLGNSGSEKIANYITDLRLFVKKSKLRKMK